MREKKIDIDLDVLDGNSWGGVPFLIGFWMSDSEYPASYTVELSTISSVICER